MKRSGSLLVALLGSALLAALLGTWLATGWADARARASSVGDEPKKRAARVALRLASEFGQTLEAIRSSEDRRPYYEYQNLFHDPRGASTGLSVNPSPLVERTADPLIAVHYQIAGDGQLTIPPVNEEVPELSQQAALVDNRFQLTRLRGATDELAWAAPAPVAVAARTPEPRKAASVQKLEPQAFAQNARSNAVFQEAKRVTRTPRVETGVKPGGQPIEIVTEPFEWRTSVIDSKPELVATREIKTPDGALSQGFVLDAAAVATWLRARTDGSAPATLQSESGTHSAAIPMVSGWHISVASADAIATAAGEAQRIRRRFWTTFGGASIAAMLALGWLVWMVRRSEQLARERSRFAAAAAHELRTPLAGLQLYGEMLADGLGDPSQSQNYAQRVSDEAARLGRVVGNVLGFTELERGTLAVDVQPGDLATSVRRAVERARSSLEAAGVTLAIEAPERCLARYDEDAVARIMQNLLDNAEKYSRESSDRSVRVAVRDPADEPVRVEVSDGGRGVPERERERIFRPFERAVGSDDAAGLGLGLALARTLARDQGGDLHCEAGTSGARFVLSLARVAS